MIDLSLLRIAENDGFYNIQKKNSHTEEFTPRTPRKRRTRF